MGSELALPREGRGGGEANLFWNSPEGDSERPFAILSLSLNTGSIVDHCCSAQE